MTAQQVRRDILSWATAKVQKREWETKMEKIDNGRIKAMKILAVRNHEYADPKKSNDELWDEVREGNKHQKNVESFDNEKRRQYAQKIRESLNKRIAKASEELKKQSQMTAEEKIASVHIDFDKDNILPELNEEDLKDLGIQENKKVRLKKLIIDRNMLKHYDISAEDSEVIIGKALYSKEKQIIPNKDKSKPNYYSFASFIRVSRKSKKDIFGVVMIDIDDKKDAFEIVHWHYVPYDRLGNIKGE